MNDEVKQVIRDNMYELIVSYIENNIPFRLVLNNKDDWDIPLPKSVIDLGSNIIIEIAQDMLEDSYIDEFDNIVISTVFENKQYFRVLEDFDLLGILNLDNSPIYVKPFKEDIKVNETKIEEVKQDIPLKDIFNISIVENEDGIKQSIYSFKKNNQDTKYKDYINKLIQENFK